VVAKDDLSNLLSQLDEETRKRWERYLLHVDTEVSERGPQVVREHLDAALEHLLAVGWALHRCYAVDDATQRVMGPLGDAASTVEQLRQVLDEIAKKPEWSQ
jgi:hypothetical protein